MDGWFHLYIHRWIFRYFINYFKPYFLSKKVSGPSGLSSVASEDATLSGYPVSPIDVGRPSCSCLCPLFDKDL